MGAVDFGIVNSAVDTVQLPSNKVTYIKWSDKNCYDIGKYASEAVVVSSSRKVIQEKIFQNSMKVQHALSKRGTRKNLMKVKKMGLHLASLYPNTKQKLDDH